MMVCMAPPDMMDMFLDGLHGSPAMMDMFHDGLHGGSTSYDKYVLQWFAWFHQL